MQQTGSGGGEIAIIGMACRYPGAANLGEYWRNLVEGIESVRFFTDAELLAAGMPPDEISDPRYVKAKAVLEGIAEFDAGLFGLSPREAEITDPQQRLFLQCAWEALENAGYRGEYSQDQIGIFAGAGRNGYWQLLSSAPGIAESVGDFRLIIGNDKDHLTTFTAYKLGLKGPCLNIQTACSTSLVAVHLACQSLLGGECDLALAGGVSIDVSPRSGYLYQEGGILSPDGHCRAFDARAQGTVGGSGVGLVLLKRLEEAIADADMIYAVIKGSAINNDGGDKVGYTAPSIDGQARVIAEALAVAGTPPETITCVEAHGTGTPLGDPIEVEALTQVFRAGTAKKKYCALGSVKTNIGHTDTAAGIAGLIKMALSLWHGILPPSLHFNSPNPRIDFENSPFYVPVEASAWKPDSHPRRCGISSFGIGGTNAHLILEEAPALPAALPESDEQLILLSGRTAEARENALVNLATAASTQPNHLLSDIAFTLQNGRKPFDYRLAFIARDRTDLLRMTESETEIMRGHAERLQKPVIFMFPGQGSQYLNMARSLYERIPLFKDTLDHCLGLLSGHLGVDLHRSLYPIAAVAADEKNLQATLLAQPTLFAIEYSLASFWMRLGIHPQALIGHSLGEYTAACIAGVFSLEDAARIIAIRARLMQSLPPGAMLAVGLGEQDIVRYLRADVSLAAINGARRIVISGSLDTVGEIEAQLKAEQIACQRLSASHAFHSNHMEPILEQFQEAFKQITLSLPRIRFISNLTGSWIQPEEAVDPTYWRAHLRQPVRMADGIKALRDAGDPILLEVGPGRTLSGLVAEQLGSSPLCSLGPARQVRNEFGQFLATAGRLWIEGARIDWRPISEGKSRRRVPLPTYPFEKTPFWITAPPIEHREIHNLGKASMSEIFTRQFQMMTEQLEWLYEHSIHPNP